MAGWTLIGSGSYTGTTGGTAASLTVGAGGVPAGALIVVCCYQASATLTGAAVADSRSNTYISKVTGAPSGRAGLLFESYNLATALQSGDTITFTPHTGALSAGLAAYYRTDAITASDPFDQSASATGTSTTPSSGATGTTTQANEAAFGFIVGETGTASRSFTAGSGWTGLTGVAYAGDGGVQFVTIGAEWQDLSSTGTVTATGNASGSYTWAAIAATFKLAGGGTDANVTIGVISETIATEAQTASGGASTTLSLQTSTLTAEPMTGHGSASVGLGLQASTITAEPVTAGVNVDAAIGSIATTETLHAPTEAGGAIATIGTLASTETPEAVIASAVTSAPIGLQTSTVTPEAVTAAGAAAASIGTLASVVTPEAVTGSGGGTAPIGFLAETIAPKAMGAGGGVTLSLLTLTEALKAMSAAGTAAIAIGSLAVLETLEAVTAGAGVAAPIGFLTLTETPKALTAGVAVSVTIGSLSVSVTLYAPTLHGGAGATLGLIAVHETLYGFTILRPTLITARRLPRFFLALYVALQGPRGPLTRTDGIDINPDNTSLTITTAAPIGFQGLDAGYARIIRTPDNLSTRQFGPLERAVAGEAFGHVALYEGTALVWEGRNMLAKYPGGMFNALQCKGYGDTGLNDGLYQPGASNATMLTSGAILRQAVQLAAPVVTPGNMHQFQDPGILHALSEFDSKPPAQVATQIANEGNAAGVPVYYAVWEGRALHLLPVTAPDVPDYIVPNDARVDWQEQADDAAGTILLSYTDIATGSAATLELSNPAWPGDHNGFNRVVSVSGGTMSAAGAYQYALTYLAIHATPTIACTITRTAPDGLETQGNIDRAPWLVRSGDWVRVGDWTQVSLQIVRTTYDASQKLLTVECGSPAFAMRRLEQQRNVYLAHYNSIAIATGATI